MGAIHIWILPEGMFTKIPHGKSVHFSCAERMMTFVCPRKALPGGRGGSKCDFMQCTFSSDGNVLVASPSGQIDMMACNDFKVAIHANLDETKAKHLVIDLADLEYLTSAGFREFFLAGRRMGREGGTLSVCRLQPMVKELFEIAQFNTAYAIHGTREAAVAAAKAL